MAKNEAVRAARIGLPLYNRNTDDFAGLESLVTVVPI